MLSKCSHGGSAGMKKTLTSVLRFNVEQLRQQTIATSTKVREESTEVKPFSEIPGPKGLPFVGNLLSLPSYLKEDKWYEHYAQRFAQYGPIFKEQVGPYRSVHLCDVNAIEEVHRKEGKYPRRWIIGAWKTWREEQGLAKGIIVGDGEHWKRMRTTLDRRMMRLAHVATYADSFNEVVTDFVNRLRTVRDQKGGGQKVPNMDFELFYWSLESICTVLYEIRLGCLSDRRSPMTVDFVNAVQGVFASTSDVVYFPPAVNRIFMPKAQKLHDDSWKTVFKTTQYLVDEKLQQLKVEQAKVGEPSEVTAGLLSYLLSTDMPMEEVYANISELMLAAVDTTATTLQWALYELSRDRTVQQQLHKEVTSVAPLGKVPSHDDLQKMPLLKAVVKEVLRMYPVTTTSTRVLNEDLVLCGYQVPKDTLVLSQTYHVARDPKLFADPNIFKPQRWLRSENTSTSTNPFAWLPFGYGPRMCVGRRVAELEMYLLLARISQTFELIPEDVPLRAKQRSLLVPERPVNVTFVDRSA